VEQTTRNHTGFNTVAEDTGVAEKTRSRPRYFDPSYYSRFVSSLGAKISGWSTSDALRRRSSSRSRFIVERSSEGIHKKMVDKKMKSKSGCFLSHLLVHHLLVPFGSGCPLDRLKVGFALARKPQASL